MSHSSKTPPRRTRLTRQEWVVGLFVVFAVLMLLLAAFLYLRQMAERKGWFIVQAPYFTFVESAAGIQVRDKVKLMGFDVGEITKIDTMEPFAPWNVYVAFTVHKPYEGYVWSDSKARIAAGNLLGNRGIELTKGGMGGIPSYLFHPVVEKSIDEALSLEEPHNWKFGSEIRSEDPGQPRTRLFEMVTRSTLEQLSELGTNIVRVFNTDDVRSRLMAQFDDKAGAYVPFTEESEGFFILPDEAPALTDRLDMVMRQVEEALPHVLSLTNEVRGLFKDATNLTHQTVDFLAETRALTTNLAVITAQLREPDGALGRWLLSADLRHGITSTLASARQSLGAAQATAQSAETNLAHISAELLVSLENLSLITSNLNVQVQANAFILGDVSNFVRGTDAMMQGLRRHWLLKGAFPETTPDTPAHPLQPRLAPPP